MAGLSTVESVVPFNLNRSPSIGLSPSKVANAKLARTGAGAGTVLNPETGTSKFGLFPGTLMALKPSKLVIDLPGSVGSSYTTKRDQPAECPVLLGGLKVPVSPKALDTFASVYVPKLLVKFVTMEVTSA